MVAQDRVPVVADQATVHHALKIASGNAHSQRRLSHLHHRQALVIEALHHRPGKVRVEGDFLRVEAGA